jgi:FAD/FMN-containing dehydrogenase
MFLGRRRNAAPESNELPPTAVWPADEGYGSARTADNARLDFHPAVVVYCLGAEDVGRCVRWAVANDKRIAIRSGGHDYEGFSLNDDGIVIDLSRYCGITMNDRRRSAWIRAGTDFKTTYRELARFGRTLPGGTCPSVAIGGLATGGGKGMLVRRYGLLSDRLARVRLVDAAGRIRDSDDDELGAELLWACRGGGGGSFGVVTDLKFDLVDAPRHVNFFSVRWPWSADTFASIAERWMTWPDRTRALTAVLTAAAGQSTGIHVFGQFLGERKEIGSLLDELCAGTKTTERRRERLRYLEAVDIIGGPPVAPRLSYKMKSSLADEPLNSAGIEAVIESVAGLSSNVLGILQFDTLGGAVQDLDSAATAFPHRKARYSLQYQTYWTDQKDAQSAQEWIAAAFERIDPHTSMTSYRNYADLDLSNWSQRYFGANYPRLQRIKAALDPDNRFSFPQSIQTPG